MNPSQCAIGTELRGSHGTRWVKVAVNTWRARAEWGVLDMWTTYSDADVHGEPVTDSYVPSP